MILKIDLNRSYLNSNSQIKKSLISFDDLSKKLLIIFTLFCSFRSYSNEQKSYYKPKDEHVRIVVGDDINYPPYSYLDQNGLATGFNIELIKAVADEMGFDIEIRLGEWSSVKEELLQGDLDVISGMFYSQEREAFYSFSTKHNMSVGDIFTREGFVIQDFNDLIGKTVAVQKGDIMAELLEKMGLDIKIIYFNTVRDALYDLANGKYDYAALMKVPGLYTIKEENVKGIINQNINIKNDDYCFVVKKGNENLLTYLNSGLMILKATGKYDQLYDEWFGILEERDFLTYLKRYKNYLIIGGLFVLLSFLLNIFLKIIITKKTKVIESNEKKYKKYLENLPMAVGIAKMDGTITYLNPTFTKLFGYTLEDIPNITIWSNKAYPDENDRIHYNKVWEEDIAAFLKNPFELLPSRIYKIQSKSKDLIIAEITFSIYENELYTMFNDITEKDKLQSQLDKNTILFEKVFDLLPYSCTISDLNGTYLKVNKAYQKAIELNESEILGKKPVELGDVIDLAHQKEIVDELIKNEVVNDIEVKIYRSRLGKYFDILFSSTIFDFDGEKLVISATVDITNRKKMEEDLARSEENLRITLNSIGDAVITTDAEGLVTNLNPVAEVLTGWKKIDAFGIPLPEVFKIINAETRNIVENPAEIVLRTGKIVGLANHTVLISKDKKEYQIADSGAPIIDKNGNIVGVVLVFRDVTKEYALQDQLFQSQKMDAIGQLAGGIAHDFNNMLGGITGAAELLKKKVSDDKGFYYISIINEAASRASDLSRNLLAFARKQAPGSTTIDVHKSILNTVSLLSNTIDKKISIETSLKADQFFVTGDDSQLQSVFLNMGINASQAISDGGVIKFETDKIILDKEYCDKSTFNLSPGSYLEIKIIDTGSGIPLEIIPKIFDPFFTTKKNGKGTGLGLSSAYGIIHQHKGAVIVNSEIGKGTCFKIYIPLVEGFDEKIDFEHEIENGYGSILLVDDELIMRVTGKALLEEIGYKVDTAVNGIDAIKKFESDLNKYDLVILDMIMPEMNGRDCFVKLRKIDPEIKIIIASGFSRLEDLEDLKAKNLNGFIQKPFQLYEINKIISEVLRK
ncbi:MAG: transporter substrate-binding domain-containing protein [Candidatus Delongbacteria bacterium]|nr:transporter substrate-binding domain-containing protein [Candidatus Delongbacteria bacterium]MBN2835100.1 transporter substrate-binding domain-containing protein [Candidatus Delongbacteria bacterium]